MSGYVTLGIDVETGQPIRIGDTERCGGLYVLGRPRTGKSYSFISLALQDIARGIGLLFIDPHEDAIQAILDRLPGNCLNDVILLDPTDSEYAFGINPLYCHNPHDLRERQLTFGQTWDVFAKVFAEEDERLGILLSKYLGNCLYPLIEHQGYTLYDLWDFLLDESFRESVLSTVTYHPEVVKFWHEAYGRLLPRDKIGEPQSLLNRLDALQRNPYIKHVISQPTPSFDFVKVMEQRKIVLLRMPPSQDNESKAFIGTLVISQLLKAIFLRADVSEHLRTSFAIYCDEFQLFATPDFAKLFTQTGKYRIMPSVAHQDRVGQFKPNDPNRGATMVALNKVIFSTSVPDSKEIAPELAKDSPTETKRERVLVISQQPVEDILRGHANATVQRFVTEYLRSLSHRLEDTEAAKEGVRIKRQQYLDGARLNQSVAQLYKEDLTNSASWRFYAVKAVLESVVELQQKGQGQNRKLLELFHSTQALRQLMRNLDSFLTAIMEGRIAKGQEAYARFLRELLSVFFPISPPLALYIALAYGDSRLSREIPFELARRHGLYRSEVVALEEHTNRERREYIEREYARVERDCAKENQKRRQEFLQQKAMLRERVERRLFHNQGGFTGMPIAAWYPNQLYRTFVWLECCPSLLEIMSPVIRHLGVIPADMLRIFKELFSGKYTKSDVPYLTDIPFSRRHTMQKFLLFLQTCPGIPAIVSLLNLSHNPWRQHWYENLCMLDFPKFPGVDPIELLRVILKINETKRLAQKDFDQFTEGYLRYFDREVDKPKNTSSLSFLGRKRQLPPDIAAYLLKLRKVDSSEHWVLNLRTLYELTLETLIKHLEYRQVFKISSVNNTKISRMASIRNAIEQSWDRFAKQYPRAADVYRQCDELEQVYLVARAYELFFYGQQVANATFPEPNLRGAGAAVTALVPVIEELMQERPLRIMYQVGLEAERRRVRDGKAKIAKISYSPPALLAARHPRSPERTALKNACLAELSGSSVFTALNDFVRFCDLITCPENHVQVPSTQYIETQVNTYTTHEMINQMERELIDLPRWTAYAKVVQEVDGTQSVRKAKIQTVKLAAPHSLVDVSGILRSKAIGAGILKKRSEIDKEIILRQAKRGFGMGNDPSPPTDAAGDQPPALSSGRLTRKSVPPPTHYIPPQTPAQQVFSDEGGQPRTNTAKKASPKAKQKTFVQQDSMKGTHAMANKKSTKTVDALMPAPLPPQAPYFDIASDSEPNREEGYRVRPFYLCMDVSGSMGMTIADGRTVMDDVNDEIADLLTSMKKKPEVCDVTRLSIVSFASDAKVELPLANLQKISAMPVLKAGGGTSFTHALRRLREVIEEDYQNRGPNSWNRPIVAFMTDGYPDNGTEAAWQAARDALLDPEWKPHPNLAVFGFGKANHDIIITLAAGQKYSGLACIAEEGQTPSAEVGRIMDSMVNSMVHSRENPEQFGMEVPDRYVILKTPGDDNLD